MTLLFPTRGHPTEEAGRGPTRELEAVNHCPATPHQERWPSGPPGARFSHGTAAPGAQTLIGSAQGPAKDHAGLQRGDHPAKVTDVLRWAQAELARAG